MDRFIVCIIKILKISIHILKSNMDRFIEVVGQVFRAACNLKSNMDRFIDI